MRGGGWERASDRQRMTKKARHSALHLVYACFITCYTPFTFTPVLHEHNFGRLLSMLCLGILHCTCVARALYQLYTYFTLFYLYFTHIYTTLTPVLHQDNFGKLWGILYLGAGLVSMLIFPIAALAKQRGSFREVYTVVYTVL